MTAKLLNERINKKVMGMGTPDSRAIKEGATKIKYHLDYMSWLLDQRRWLAGDAMSLADFSAAAHLSCLDYISDVDWNRSAVVKDLYAKIKSRPSFRTLLADQVPGSVLRHITPISISRAAPPVARGAWHRRWSTQLPSRAGAGCPPVRPSLLPTVRRHDALRRSHAERIRMCDVHSPSFHIACSM